MSAPAGWYDDGSGQQRWWDGVQWTENYAPLQGAVDPAAADAQAPASGVMGVPAYAASPGYAAVAAPVPVGSKLPSTLGFVGLGLAVLGTILACIPTVVTVSIGLVVLLAAFVVSLIAVFKKHTSRWPSIVGIVLSIVGGMVGAIVLIVTIATAITNIPDSDLPAPPPTSSTSEQPSTGDTEARPSPEAIAEGYLIGIKDEQGIDEYKTPEVLACLGQELYDSDLSDALLRKIAAGTIISYDTVGQADGDAFVRVGSAAMEVCSPYGAG